MKRKTIIIILCFVSLILLISPVCAKQTVKIKISTQDHYSPDKGFITIKLVDKKGKSISSKGTIHYNITDSKGNYKWTCKAYPGKILLKYPNGKYKVKVKFDGDSKYKKAKLTKSIKVDSPGFFNPYTYYDDHNWGLNQKIDDYIEDNYWDEEIYDDASNYDGEGY